MVSIVQRLPYLDELRKSNKVDAFLSFLSARNINIVPEVSNATDLHFYKAINAILNEDKAEFLSVADEFSKREPDSQSPYIHDDFLLFILICGIKKFSAGYSWLQNAINARNDSELESVAIKTTLINVLNGNFASTDNLFELIIVLQSILEKSFVSLAIMNLTYYKITTLDKFPPYKSVFLNVITFRAYDIIVESKDLSPVNELALLRGFNSRFVKRAKVLAWIIQTALLVAILYWGIELVSTQPAIKQFLDKFSSVLEFLAIFGFSQIVNIFPIIKRVTFEALLRILGYPATFIKDIKTIEHK